MKRRYLWWGLGTLVVLIVVVVAAGPWAYSKWIAGDADEELKLPTSTQAASESVDGAWTVVPRPLRRRDPNTGRISSRRDPARATRHGERPHDIRDRHGDRGVVEVGERRDHGRRRVHHQSGIDARQPVPR